MSQLRGNQLNIQDIADDPTMTSTFATGAHTHVEADITDLQAYIVTETDPVFLAQKGVANGVATLDAGGLILGSQLPAIAITDTFVVADEPAMLALTAQTGDVAVRTDLSKAYILQGASASTLTDWQELLTPVSPVQSVDGLTGAVSLTGVYAPLTHTHLMADITDSTWISDITGQSINNLSDVTITAPSANEVIAFDGTNWVNQSAALSLTDLTDVTASPVTGELIHYNGTGWSNTSNMFYDAANSKLGIGTKFPNVSSGLIQTTGDIDIEGAYRFRNAADNTVPLVLYRGGTNFAILRDYADAYTIQQIWSPPGDVISGGDREATLALVRGDEPNQEFMDVYNNGYATEKQFGIRLQKRGTGLFRDFVIDYDDGTTKTPVLRIQPDQSSTFSGTVTLAADPVGNLEASTKQYVDTADNLKVNKAGDTMTGNLSLGDNNHIYLGTGLDLDIYHNGGNSVVKNNNSSIFVENAVSAAIAEFTQSASKLYTEGSLKLETLTTGVSVTGDLSVSQAPTASDHVTRKDYVDTKFANPNKIINGNFDIWQRGTSFTSISAQIVTTDRFRYINGSTAVHNVARSVLSPSITESGITSNYSMLLEATTADTVVDAGDYTGILYKVEGYDFVGMKGGNATLSFWVRSSVTGTYCIAFRNETVDRSYIVEYSINAVDTWEKKTITVPLTEATGVWNTTNGTGLDISFTTMVGATYQTTANTWQTGNFIGTVNQANFNATAGNQFRISQIKLEAGDIATPFVPKSYAKELRECQRYFEQISAVAAFNTFATAIAASTTSVVGSIAWEYKRAVPLATMVGAFRANGTVSLSATTADIDNEMLNLGRVTLTVSGATAGDGYLVQANNDATAYISIDAEL